MCRVSWKQFWPRWHTCIPRASLDAKIDRARVPPSNGSDPTSPLEVLKPLWFQCRISLTKRSKNKGMQGVGSRYDVVLPPFFSIVWSPGRPVMSVPESRLQQGFFGSSQPSSCKPGCLQFLRGSALLGSFAPFCALLRSCSLCRGGQKGIGNKVTKNEKKVTQKVTENEKEVTKK